MSETRTNKVILIAGNRGTGKTDWLKNLALVAPMNVMIIDTFDSPVWRNMKTWNRPDAEAVTVHPISAEDIEKGEYQKAYTRYQSSDTKRTMSLVDKYLYNSLVIFEDATKYIGSRLTDDEKRLVLDSKQKNVDFVFCFHSLSTIPKDLIRVSDFLVLFKTNEVMDSSLNKRYGNNLALVKAFEKVQKSSNRYHNEQIQLGG